jgi:hypothetical protein
MRQEWPSTPGADTFALPEDRQNHVLDVYLVQGRLTDLRLDGKSVYPTWFEDAPYPSLGVVIGVSSTLTVRPLPEVPPTVKRASEMR